MGKIKQQRVAEQIRVSLSDLLLYEVGDPRIQGITIVSVDIDRELQHADVKVNALGDDERAEEVMLGLRSAHSFLRRELGRRLKLRKVPQIHFHWDHSIKQAEEVNSLLDSLVIPQEEPISPPDTEVGE